MTMSERNLAKRADLVEKWGTNYFRDFKNIRKYRSGKTFMANRSIFKKEAALYFPNLRGQTLAEAEADTANVMKGKVSVVNVYSSAWGEAQVRTFTSKEKNPALHELLGQHDTVAQQIEINIEENPLKAWIIKIFAFKQRVQRRKEDWGKYFVVRKGVDQRIRETIGLLNGRVGYVYLLDQNCKIRWAGSADAEGTEKEDLTRGLRRLIDEAKVVPKAEIGRGKNATGKDERVEKGMPVLVPVAFK
jgi:ATPase complex subunit ATP10